MDPELVPVTILFVSWYFMVGLNETVKYQRRYMPADPTWAHSLLVAVLMLLWPLPYAVGLFIMWWTYRHSEREE